MIHAARFLLVALALGACAAPQSAMAPTTGPVTTPSAARLPSAAPSVVTPVRLTGVAKRLDAGAYIYDFALPHVTLRVPVRWYLSEAMPRHFGLHPDDVLVDESIRVWFDMRVASGDPTCPEEPASGVGHSATELVTAFSTNPGVVASAPQPVSIGGLDGQVIDVALAPGWTAACPFTDGAPSVPLFLDDNVTDEPAFWGVTGPERLRLMVLDDRHSSNVVVMIDSTTGTTLDALEATAKPVLETFRFAVGD